MASELARLREAWERADARLHAHVGPEHRAHLSPQDQARVSDVDAEIGDDLRGDPGALEAAAVDARSTYDAYVGAMHLLGQGLG
jgi:hypothetical protein